MKPNFYKILQRAIEVGATAGLYRAKKHNDAPCDGEIIEAIERAIMLEVCEYFDFDEPTAT